MSDDGRTRAGAFPVPESHEPEPGRPPGRSPHLKALAGGSAVAVVLAAGVVAAILISHHGHHHSSLQSRITVTDTITTQRSTAPATSTGSTGRSDTGTTTAQPGSTTAPLTTTQSRPPTGFTTFTSSSFGAYYPSGWAVAYRDRPIGDYRETKFVSPGGSSFVRIDRSPGRAMDPAVKARSLERLDRGAAGYRELRFDPITINGQIAFEWVFTSPDSTSPEKIDYFRNVGRDGFAILGGGHDFRTAQRAALVIAGTLEGHG